MQYCYEICYDVSKRLALQSRLTVVSCVGMQSRRCDTTMCYIHEPSIFRGGSHTCGVV